MRFFCLRVLLVAAIASLMAGGSLALSGVAPAGASPVAITVHCPADDLRAAISAAPVGATVLVDGTCTGNFFIDKDLTLSGPAVLDGGGGSIGTPFAATLNVAAGTVVLNNLTIQDGVGIFGLGGGLWNGGQLTLNHSTVTNNHASGGAGGVFNYGQLTLNGSTVSHNTAQGGGGIFNCAVSLRSFGLCLGTPSLTLNHSMVSDNVADNDGGGIQNDRQAVMTLNGSTVAGNTAGRGGGISNSGTATLNWSAVSGNIAGSGGGISNSGAATLNWSAVSGNIAGSGGGIFNSGTATLNWSAVLNNSSTGGSQFWSGGGGLSTTSTSTTTLNDSIVRANSAAWLGGGIFAGGATTITASIVTGNSAGASGGGMVAWNGPISVAYSVFAHNSDPGITGADNPAGVWVAPINFGGFFTNNPTFTTTHSIYI
jgi:hypothetical protein